MKDFKDEIQDELNRIISEKKDYIQAETEKILEKSSVAFKKQLDSDEELELEKIEFKKPKFFKRLIFVFLGFFIIFFLVFSFYKLDYFKQWREDKKD